MYYYLLINSIATIKLKKLSKKDRGFLDWIMVKDDKKIKDNIIILRRYEQDYENMPKIDVDP